MRIERKLKEMYRTIDDIAEDLRVNDIKQLQIDTMYFGKMLPTLHYAIRPAKYKALSMYKRSLFRALEYLK